MAVVKSGARFLGVMLLGFGLAACSGQQERPLDTYTAEEIFKMGELRLEASRRPDDAIRYFQEVERLYPYSQVAKRALIMQAFSYHKAKKYEEARAAAQRYLDFYPGDEDAPYALYLMALSYYDQIDDVGRDQGVTFQALQGMRDVIETYPDSDYARSAMLKFELAFDHLAGKEMEIGRHYQRMGLWLAADMRFRNVVEKFDTTSHTPEALYRLCESSLALGVPQEAVKYAAVLGANYPGSEWYERAFKLVNKNAEGVVAS